MHGCVRLLLGRESHPIPPNSLRRNALHATFCIVHGFWKWFATCGSAKGRRALLGNHASLILSWTVATAVFDALDIVATFCYEEPSRPAIVSSLFSFFSIWYGLFQRRNDFDDLSKLGAKRKPIIHLGKLAEGITSKWGSAKGAIRHRVRNSNRGRSAAPSQADMDGHSIEIVEQSQSANPLGSNDIAQQAGLTEPSEDAMFV